MAVLFTDQDHDNPYFGDIFNSRDFMTWNASEFESGDEAEFFAYNTINGSSPLVKVNSSLICYPDQYCVIKEGSDITFTAGELVKLYPGFHAKPGSHFRATIQQKKKPDSLLISPKKLNLPALDSITIDTLINDGYSIIKKSDELADPKTVEELSETDFVSNGQFEFSLFPNPNQGIFSIGINGGYEGNYSIEIVNVMGNRIYHNQDISRKKLEINITNYPKGLYFVKVQAGDNIFSEKIIFK